MNLFNLNKNRFISINRILKIFRHSVCLFFRDFNRAIFKWKAWIESNNIYESKITVNMITKCIFNNYVSSNCEILVVNMSL